MQFSLKLEGDVLSLAVTGVEDTPEARGRVANIEIAFLHHYGDHTSEPVRRGEDGKLSFLFHREGSSWRNYEGCRRILRGFNVEVP